MFGQFVSVAPCPTCGGEGTVVADPCPKCGGDGRVRTEKTVQIDVPAGVADHHYLTMRGQGVPGPRNGPPGRSEEHTSELQSQSNLVCRLLLEKKKKNAHEHR